MSTLFHYKIRAWTKVNCRNCPSVCLWSRALVLWAQVEVRWNRFTVKHADSIICRPMEGFDFQTLKCSISLTLTIFLFFLDYYIIIFLRIFLTKRDLICLRIYFAINFNIPNIPVQYFRYCTSTL